MDNTMISIHTSAIRAAINAIRGVLRERINNAAKVALLRSSATTLEGYLPEILEEARKEAAQSDSGSDLNPGEWAESFMDRDRDAAENIPKPMDNMDRYADHVAMGASAPLRISDSPMREIPIRDEFHKAYDGPMGGKSASPSLTTPPTDIEIANAVATLKEAGSLGESISLLIRRLAFQLGQYQSKTAMRKFEFTWKDGKIERGEGTSVRDAFAHLGYGAGAMAALGSYKELES